LDMMEKKTCQLGSLSNKSNTIRLTFIDH